MTKDEFIYECRASFERNSLPCTESDAERLFLLTERMLEVNKSLNLTAIKEEKAIILKHYVDSLKISEHIPENSKMIDVGCGAGFPTLPLAIFRPDLSIVALDGTAKRINYVAQTADMLGLSGVHAVAARAEELARDEKYRESFDIATARAVASLPVLCELCLPFVKVGGTMIAMKAKDARDELEAAKNAIGLCGSDSKCTRMIPCSLVSENRDNDERNLIFMGKIKKTPQLYPRHFSKISKKTL